MTLLLVFFGVLAIVSAIGVVTCRKTVYSAMSLVGNVASLAVIYLLLNAQFLFAVQLIIYAGAIVVLFIFIIALLNPDREDRPAIDRKLLVGLAGVIVLTTGMITVAGNGITSNHDGLRGAQVGAATSPAECRHEAPTRCHDPYAAFSFAPSDVNTAGNVQTLGVQLFTTFLLPFEITSLLLLSAAIGAVYLTRRPPATGRSRRRHRPRPEDLPATSPAPRERVR